MTKVLLLLVLFIPILSLADNIKVLVIDTGVQGENSEFKPFIKEKPDQNYQDQHGHGTHVAGLITKDVCKQVELISCKAFYIKEFDENLYLNCLRSAISKKVNFINFSGGGTAQIPGEHYLLKELSQKGVKIIVATGNNNRDLKKNCNYYPACYTIANLVPVGALDKKGKKWFMSNYGIDKMAWEEGEEIISSSTKPGFKTQMSGSSMATAIHTNKLVKKKCRELNK